MSLLDGAEYQNYIFTVQATATQKNQKGETVENDVQFTFILRLESGVDLDLQLNWQTLTAPAQATCSANGSISLPSRATHPRRPVQYDSPSSAKAPVKQSSSARTIARRTARPAY